MTWAFIFWACTAQAQNNPMENAASNKQIFKMGLYPPDVIMKHQQRLGISDEQRKHISAAVKVFQTDVAELQWTLQNEQQEFKQALSGYKIETKEAMAKAENLLKMESQFKLAHFNLLFAIKNELTQEQIDIIRKVLRDRGSQDQ
ncbi:MAG: hypothetical protein ACJAUG_000095 [Halioglobus sp.]|jgi:hypothetical protein